MLLLLEQCMKINKLMRNNMAGLQELKNAYEMIKKERLHCGSGRKDTDDFGGKQ